MRTITAVLNDIKSSNGRLEKTKENIKKKAYNDYFDVAETFAMPLLCYISLLILTPCFFWIPMLYDNDYLSWLGFFAGLAWVVFMITIYVESANCFGLDIEYSSAKTLLIISGAILAADVISVIMFANNWIANPGLKQHGMFDIDLAVHINPQTFPVFFVNNTVNSIVLRHWVCSVAISAIPHLIIFIAALIHFIKEAVKMTACNKAVAALQGETQIIEGMIGKLMAEKEANISESNKLYNSEIKKENPDQEMIKEAAEHGCADAGLDVSLDLCRELLSKKQELNNSQISSFVGKIKHYVELSDGCKNKKLLEAVDLFSWFYDAGGYFSSYSESRDEFNKLDAKKTQLEKLLNSNDADVKLLANDIKYPLFAAVANARNELEKKEAEEAEWRAEQRRREKEEEERIWYSGLTSSYTERKLSNDELRELNDKITGGDWNPGAILRSNLSDSEKEQLMSYNSIYGD